MDPRPSYGAIGDDEVTLGIDGAAGSPTSLDAAYDFTWVRGGTIEVASPGVHTISLWMREDGAVVDRLLLTPDAAYMPEGAGPDESGHEPPDPPVEPPGGDPTGCGCHALARSTEALVAFAVLGLVLFRRRCGGNYDRT